MKIFATMSWEDMAKGLVGAAAGIAAVGLAANLLPASLIVTGPGLILLAAGLAALGGALRIFGSMDLVTMGKGILGVQLHRWWLSVSLWDSCLRPCL
jgi:hypothetical protein